jgi:preprotein translocase subunit SecB
MTEQTNSERQLVIQRIYTKDLSFESPNAPSVFLSEWKPEIDVNIRTAINDLGDDNYEVVLAITVEAKHEQRTAFVAEVHQGGIFLVKGFSEAEKNPLLSIGAPNSLFPYAREVISDLVTRGSFPQFVLQPANFEAMYAQQMAAQQQEVGETH